MAFWSTLFSTKKETLPPPALASLRLQVYRSDCIAMRVLKENSPGMFAVKPLAFGLVEALVEQRATGESVLRWDVARALGKPDNELFALAATQAAATTNTITTDFDFGVQMMASNDFYLSTQLLQSFARAARPHGVLFAPISWHHWCVHVVQAATLPPVVAMMMMLARAAQEKMRVAEYEALTGDLYWYKPGGVIEKLDVVGEGSDLRATSPELEQAMDAAFKQSMRR
jgi:hypothetical protein